MKNRHTQGFTVLELIIVVAIMALAAAVAIPSINSYLVTYNLKASARNLAGTFQKARSEALANRTDCTISFNSSVDGTNYDFIVYLDNGTKNWKYDSGETLITTANLSHDSSIAFTTSGISFPTNDAGKPSVAFNSRGMPRTKDGSMGGGSVAIKNSKGTIHTVVLTPLGGVKVN